MSLFHYGSLNSKYTFEWMYGNTQISKILYNLDAAKSYIRDAIYIFSIDLHKSNFSDSKVHGTNMGPTWVLSAPDGPHVGPMNLAIRVNSIPMTNKRSFRIPEFVEMSIRQRLCESVQKHVLQSQYHVCWCSGDFRSQDINRHGIGLRRVKIYFV